MFTGNATRDVRLARALIATSIGAMLVACSTPAPVAPAAVPVAAPPFMAQVVGLQWINPLQRRDYPVEWQLLWTLGVAQPNKPEGKAKTIPKKYRSLQALNSIANGKGGKTKFAAYHQKYVREVTGQFHDHYFSSSEYFYNAFSLQDRRTWRELAGIQVEYALPRGWLDPNLAAAFIRDAIVARFEIGNKLAPTLWSHPTPPTVRVTLGGANAGFTSLSGALAYLEANPSKTVWVMNWDAPSYPPKDKQINENMVLLMLAGPNYNTERAPLAWLGYPASGKAGATWRQALDQASRNVGVRVADIGYVIHDAGNQIDTSASRRASLSGALGAAIANFDFEKHAFDTPARLGEMGAGTALTNVALGIAYANHFGKPVLVAGTTALEESTAVMVSPPAVVRPIDPHAPWHRAKVGNLAYKPWWGLRHDAKPAAHGLSN